MSNPEEQPYGGWSSPITAELLVTGAAQISEVIADPVRPNLLWWAESRPDDGGRTAVMCCDLTNSNIQDSTQEVTPPDANVRTRVHEYGGGAWWTHDGVLYYVDYSDQRLRRLHPDSPEPILLTPEPATAGSLRYADGRVTPDGNWIICVHERHEPSDDSKVNNSAVDNNTSHPEPINELVAIPTDGSRQVKHLWQQSDFVMSPRISGDGKALAWISWDHPNMPWDSTRLHVYELNTGELSNSELTNPITEIGGNQSFCEPGWIIDDTGNQHLLVCSDHEGWWNLYEVDLPTGALIPQVTGEYDIATPPWVFGMQRWAGSGSNGTGLNGTGLNIAVVAGKPSGDELHVNGTHIPLPDTSISSLTMISSLQAVGECQQDEIRQGAGEVFLAYAGAGFAHETEVILVSRVGPAGLNARNACVSTFKPDKGQLSAEDTSFERIVVRPARDLNLDKALLVTPEHITFPTSSATAHALYYPPANPDFTGPPEERPPLMVLAHGGPTAQARRQLQLATLYWTSRGFAVVDVDYRGSTGYGRAYRQLLNAKWGVADVADCVAAAKYLANRGDIDPNRITIRGSSAGGFTALAALAFHDTFTAGASRYGIGDLAVLAKDTHKFEARYLDTLIGPWPAAADIYAARSPALHLDGFDAPMIVLQGSEDEIVPPSQAELIVDALKSKGVPVAYVLFEGEQHGFRQADNIVKALESELSFFAAVLGFTPADALPEIEIYGEL